MDYEYETKQIEDKRILFDLNLNIDSSHKIKGQFIHCFCTPNWMGVEWAKLDSKKKENQTKSKNLEENELWMG